jgi:hypothetical protein
MCYESVITLTVLLLGEKNRHKIGFHLVQATGRLNLHMCVQSLYYQS